MVHSWRDTEETATAPAQIHTLTGTPEVRLAPPTVPSTAAALTISVAAEAAWEASPAAGAVITTLLLTVLPVSPGEGGGGGGGVGGGFRPMGGGGFNSSHQIPLTGQKRGHPFSGRGGSPDNFDGGNFAKLFIGSVPRTATEEDIRPLFEEHGNVLEVALIKDKRTGQQQGCCFIKYTTSEEADRAIRGLHNQHTLPGGVGPIQVRYADGERERLGAVEYKLFVGSLNKQATEKEVEEIFSPYGRVEDVYLMRDEMKQSRGCGFVKFSSREMAMAAINGLSGIYTMKGCDQPLTVRFADPKRPRAGESRGGPAFGGPGFGPRFQPPGLRPTTNLGEPMHGRIPPNAWHPMSPQNMGPSLNAGMQGFGSQLLPRSGDLAMPSTLAFSQLQQQFQQMQPSNQTLMQQQSSQATKQQAPWAGMVPQTVASTPAITSAADVQPATSAASVLSAQVPQTQQAQLQAQLRHPQQLQQSSFPSSYQASGVTGHQNAQELNYTHLQAAAGSATDPARFQQGIQAAQDWMWKNKPSGT
ncbi:Flowering time control protein FCA [Camellia lanceoleosa]|uniref:Flowering time control protein FCA n=1 Tax=Camellia lanceoleosa TaxID=1840588 RepID=A0ACC0HEU0_9ERIC|nr:Flowering time control protein FCA [Camellia lanceoleosa]